MAMDLIQEKKSGRMVALRAGKYTDVPANILAQGVKRVDVDELYDVEAYQPKVRHVNGKPMFLY
jgi:6-phosphofructokinase 1